MSATASCNRCGHANRPAAVFCTACGRHLATGAGPRLVAPIASGSVIVVAATAFVLLARGGAASERERVASTSGREVSTSPGSSYSPTRSESYDSYVPQSTPSYSRSTVDRPVTREPEPVPVAARPEPRLRQLDYTTRQIEFLGWTEDGERFVIEATHGTDRSATQAEALITLRQVHETLTWEMVDSYRVAQSVDDGTALSEDLDTAWTQAQPAEAWESFAATTELVGAKSALRSPDKRWRISGAPGDRRPKGTSLRVKSDDGEIVYTWSGFPRDAKRSRRRYAEIVYTLKGSGKYEILEGTVPFNYNAVVQARSDEDPVVEGRTQVFFSPDERRAVMLHHSTIRGLGDQVLEDLNKAQSLRYASYFVRALGPQVRVIDSGAGEERARAVAETLVTGGVTVTNVGLRETASTAGTEIYYREPDGQAITERLQELLPGIVKTEQLTKDGWYSVVVLVGSDAAP